MSRWHGSVINSTLAYSSTCMAGVHCLGFWRHKGGGRGGGWVQYHRVSIKIVQYAQMPAKLPTICRATSVRPDALLLFVTSSHRPAHQPRQVPLMSSLSKGCSPPYLLHTAPRTPTQDTRQCTQPLVYVFRQACPVDTSRSSEWSQSAFQNDGGTLLPSLCQNPGSLLL